MDDSRTRIARAADLQAGHAALWWLATTDAPRRGRCLSCCLSAGEVARARRLVHPERRREWMLCRGLLRHALSCYAPVAAADWGFAADPRGRPYVARPHTRPRLYFSASHAAGLVCCLVAREPAIGVDVEPLEREVPVLALAGRHFTPLEAEALRALPASPRRDAFLERWTLSEALLKACGVGLGIPLDTFRFAREPGASAFRLAPGRVPAAAAPADFLAWPWQLETRRLAGRHRVALALRRRGAEPFPIALHRARGASEPCPGCGAAATPARHG